MSDKLRLASFNASRGALNCLPRQDRSLYLTETLEAAGTDICFLPGDDSNVRLFAVQGYSQFLTPDAQDTVLLYNNARVQMRPQAVNLTAFGHLPGLEYNKLVVPQVQVLTPGPHSKVIKEFNIVAWRHNLFNNSLVAPETLTESVATFSQRLAMATQNPVIISGEINLRHDTLEKIVKKLSIDAQVKFLSENQPVMAEYGFLPSMTKASLKEKRHLFMMKVIKCEHEGIRRSNGTDVPVVADCFIASKSLNLANAALTNVESVECRKIAMSVKEPCNGGGMGFAAPIIAALPLTIPTPTHHGG